MAAETTFVRPNISLAPETIKLSPIDQFTIRCYTPLLLCFQTKADIPDHVISSELQQGLANLLDDMYFLAGNVQAEDEACGTVLLDVSEDGAVPFKVQELRDREGDLFDFHQLESGHFPLSAFDPSVLLPGDVIPESVAPCLAVQVNFIRGGLIMALNIHHSVIDGSGIAVICKNWSRHVAAISEGRMVPASESYSITALERWSLFPVQGISRKLSEFPGFVDVQTLAVSRSNNVLGEGSPGYFRQSPDLTMTCWYISKGKLLELQEQARPRNPNEKVGTESSILSAFIWRHYSRARGLAERGFESVGLFTACDGRSLLDPPIHPDYPGNVTVHSRTEMSLTQLNSAEPDGLGQISSVIMDSVHWWTPETARCLLNSMQAYPRVGDVVRGMDATGETDLEITDISAVPTHSISWGKHLETPQAVRLAYLPVLDGQVKIMPRLPDGGLELVSFSDTAVVERLRADAEFTKYVQYRCG